jgi:ketosteroid isomerase-like protein
VQVHRLHRKLLAAHCLGDAEMIANSSAPQVLSANRGELREFSRAAVRERFSALFKTVNYTAYRDIEMPVIDISASSDLGWIGVNVRASGSVVKTGAPFSDQWAWVMMVKKIDNVWMHAGNASSNLE